MGPAASLLSEWADSLPSQTQQKKRVSFSLEVYGLPSVSLKASVLSQYLGESYYSLYISSNIYISMLVFSKKRGKSEIQKNVWGSIGGK